MAQRLKPVDVVTIGVGLTGSLAALELAETGLKVVGLERGAPRRAAFFDPQGDDAGQCEGGGEFSQQLRPDGAADPPMGKLPAGTRPGRLVRALEWPELPLPGRRLHLSHPYPRTLRPEISRRLWSGADDPGLGRYLRRARAALRSFRISLRCERQGRQHQGTDPSRRQPVRGTAVTRISEPAAEGALLRCHIPQGCGKPRLSPLPAAIVESEPALHQSARPATGAVRFLRVLRALRLRALRQSQPADDHPAGPAQEPQL